MLQPIKSFVCLQRFTRFSISMNQIKQLRDITGSPIVDCKKVLEECHGDMEQAQEKLRKSGLSKAQKKVNNAAREGVIGIRSNKNHSKVVAIEVNCETDFVARTPELLNFTDNLLQHFLKNGEVNLENSAEIEALLTQRVDEQFNAESINEARKLLISKLQENVVVSRLQVLQSAEHSVFGVYNHQIFGTFPIGLQGSVLELTSTFPLDDVKRSMLGEAASNLAICLLGMKPRWITRKQVEKEIIEEEQEKIKKDLPKNKASNENIVRSFVDGRMGKFYADNVFEDMEYMLEEINDKHPTIRQYLNKLEKDMDNGKAKIKFGRNLTFQVK